MCNKCTAAQPHELTGRVELPMICSTVDHRTCKHDFIPLQDGAVGCTICYWVWEVDEPLT